MNSDTITLLLDINSRFYRQCGETFAATRRRIQPGVRRVLAQIPPAENWLDLGCGSGALALEWLQQGRSGGYLGLDSSPVLLEEAQRVVPPGGRASFALADLAADPWGGFPEVLDLRPLHGVFSFAVLHHIPGAAARRQILQQVHRLLSPGGQFIHSEWQFQHSPRLTARIQPWEQVGLRPADVEPGDTLLDWRAPSTGHGPAPMGLRYVHLFERTELAELARDSGFNIVEEFESDGVGGRLGLYQKWSRI